MLRWALRNYWAVTAIVGALWMLVAHAGGGPLGIGHTWNYDNSGIWKRHNQMLLEDLTLLPHGFTVGIDKRW